MKLTELIRELRRVQKENQPDVKEGAPVVAIIPEYDELKVVSVRYCKRTEQVHLILS